LENFLTHAILTALYESEAIGASGAHVLVASSSFPVGFVSLAFLDSGHDDSPF
jgi:hypothetical protein